MFDVLDEINYQSYNDFVLRVGKSHFCNSHTSRTLLFVGFPCAVCRGLPVLHLWLKL